MDLIIIDYRLGKYKHSSLLTLIMRKERDSVISTVERIGASPRVESRNDIQTIVS